MTGSALQSLRSALDGTRLGYLAIVAVALMVLVRPQFLAERADRTLVANSYNTLVSDMVAAGFIVARPNLDEGQAGAPVVGMTAEALANEALNEFRFNSNLRRDLEASDDRWTFANGQLTGIDPRIHNLRDPFVLPTRWKGSIRYAQQDDEPEAGVAIVSSTGFTTRLDPRASSDDQIALVDVFSGEYTGAPSDGFDFVAGLRSDTQLIGSIRMIEQTPFASIRCAGTGAVRISFISSILPVDPCAEAGAEPILYFALRPGDGISFANASGEREGTVYSVSAFGSELSRWGTFTGRVTNPRPIAGLAEDIAESMNQFVVGNSGAAGGGKLEEAEIVLSLDAAIQKRLDDTWPGFLEGFRDKTGASDPTIGAVAVVDARSGEILGIGSQPADDQTARGRFRHQAFVPMAAGSTAKVPVSAAVLAQHPALRLLCAPTTPFDPAAEGSQKFDRVLGIPLESGTVDTVVGGGLIGFEEYLQRSSNRYAATLLMLASARTGVSDASRFAAEPDQRGRGLPAADRYGFAESSAGPCGGVPTVAQRPRFRFDFRSDLADSEGAEQLWVGGDVTTALGRDNWTILLSRMFDMPRLIPSENAFPYDTSIWQNLRRGEEDLDYFVDVSPEREDFGFGMIDNLRADYLPVILGGGQARWSTVKLAHAYGRIVSGVDVPLTMIDRGGDGANPGDALAPLGAPSRGALLRGMQRVFRNGTARSLVGYESALNGGASDGATYTIFAKTGTPSIARPDRSPANRLANELIVAGVVKRVAFETIGVVARDGEDRAAALQRAYRNVNPSGALSPEQVAMTLRWIDTTNERIRNGTERHLSFRGEQISLGEDSWKTLGENELDEGGVLALVIARSCPAGTLGPNRFERWRPSSAIAIVVNVASREDRGGRSGENPGLTFLREARLLESNSPLIEALRARDGRSGACEVPEA